MDVGTGDQSVGARANSRRWARGNAQRGVHHGRVDATGSDFVDSEVVERFTSGSSSPAGE
jgi:hypothetical protein